MALTGELEYYAAGSGLPASATLAEHQAAFWRAALPADQPGDPHTELEHAYYLLQLATTRAAVPHLVDARYAYFRGQAGHDGAVNDLMVEKFLGGGGGDVTPPTAGMLASSAITDTTFTLTVSGASDAVGLHAQPYRFSTDNGATWSPYQTSPVFNVTGKTASTAYTCVHQTRDAAGNVATGSSIVVNTASGLPTPLWKVDAGDNASYPGSGTVLTDISAGTVDMNFVNSPVYTAAAPEYISASNIGSRHLATASESSLDFVGAGSFEAWVRLQNNDEAALLSRNPVLSNGWMLWWVSGQVRLYHAGAARTAVGVPTGAWMHIVGVLDGTNARIYRDGSSVAVAAYTGVPGSNGAGPVLGGAYFSSPTTFVGSMDIGALAIYNKGLSAAEVTALFNAQRARFGL